MWVTSSPTAEAVIFTVWPLKLIAGPKPGPLKLPKKDGLADAQLLLYLSSLMVATDIGVFAVDGTIAKFIFASPAVTSRNKKAKASE